jgi:hypothetical protein
MAMTDEMVDALPAERTTVEYLLTADYAEVVNGKVYIMGAGWDRFAPPAFPAPMRLGIAAGIRVPYLESNIPHHLTITLRDGDGRELFRLDGDLETGRPPGSRGDAALVPLAVNTIVEVPGPQLLELVAQVDEGPMRRLTIRAVTARG